MILDFFFFFNFYEFKPYPLEANVEKYYILRLSAQLIPTAFHVIHTTKTTTNFVMTIFTTSLEIKNSIPQKLSHPLPSQASGATGSEHLLASYSLHILTGSIWGPSLTQSLSDMCRWHKKLSLLYELLIFVCLSFYSNIQSFVHSTGFAYLLCGRLYAGHQGCYGEQDKQGPYRHGTYSPLLGILCISTAKVSSSWSLKNYL